MATRVKWWKLKTRKALWRNIEELSEQVNRAQKARRAIEAQFKEYQRGAVKRDADAGS